MFSCLEPDDIITISSDDEEEEVLGESSFSYGRTLALSPKSSLTNRPNYLQNDNKKTCLVRASATTTWGQQQFLDDRFERETQLAIQLSMLPDINPQLPTDDAAMLISEEKENVCKQNRRRLGCPVSSVMPLAGAKSPDCWYSQQKSRAKWSVLDGDIYDDELPDLDDVKSPCRVINSPPAQDSLKRKHSADDVLNDSFKKCRHGLQFDELIKSRYPKVVLERLVENSYSKISSAPHSPGERIDREAFSDISSDDDETTQDLLTTSFNSGTAILRSDEYSDISCDGVDIGRFTTVTCVPKATEVARDADDDTTNVKVQSPLATVTQPSSPLPTDDSDDDELPDLDSPSVNLSCQFFQGLRNFQYHQIFCSTPSCVRTGGSTDYKKSAVHTRSFNMIHYNNIEGNFDEGFDQDTFVETGLQMMRSYVKTNEMPNNDLLYRVIEILLQGKREHHIYGAYHLLKYIQQLHPYLPLCVQFQFVSDIMVEIETNKSASLGQRLALAYVVSMIEDDIMHKKLGSQRDLSKTLVNQWFSLETKSKNTKSIISWLPAAWTADSDSNGVMNTTIEDTGPRLVPLLIKLLEMALTVSSTPKEHGQRMAIYFISSFSSDTIDRILDYVSSPILKCALAQAVLEQSNLTDSSWDLSALHRTLTNCTETDIKMDTLSNIQQYIENYVQVNHGHLTEVLSRRLFDHLDEDELPLSMADKSTLESIVQHLKTVMPSSQAVIKLSCLLEMME